MFRVTVSARFEAAHNLIDYEGGPEPLHGHSYKVEAVLESETLARYDLAVDFVSAKTALAALAKELDYTYLNEHPAFRGRNTSAENLARHFARRSRGLRSPRSGPRRRGHDLGRAREPRNLAALNEPARSGARQMAVFIVKTFNLQ